LIHLRTEIHPVESNNSMSRHVRMNQAEHTIDSTTIDNVGSGLESASIAGANALGMGGRSEDGGGRDCERPLPQRFKSREKKGIRHDEKREPGRGDCSVGPTGVSSPWSTV
jgi:hypothetical protein